MADILSQIASPFVARGWNARFWLRLAIVLGSPFVIVAIAYKATVDQMLLIAFVPVGIVGAIVMWRWPSVVPVVLTFVGLFTPSIGPQDVNLPMALIGVAWSVWLVERIVNKKEIRFVASRTMFPIIGLVITACIAFVAGQLSWFNFTTNAPLDAQLAGFSMFILGAGAFLLVANQVKSLRWLELMVWVFLAIGAIYVIGFSFTPLRPIIRTIFRSGTVGGVFWAWLPPLLLSQALINKKLHPGLRVLLGAITLLGLYSAYTLNYGWKSGWVPSFAAVGVTIFFVSWRMGVLCALLGIFPAAQLVPELLSSDAYSISTRLDALLIMVEIIRISPILGFGFGNYYWYTPLFRIRGWTVSFNSHNNYVDIAAQTGLLGLGFFLWFFGEAFYLGLRLRNVVPEGGFARAYVYGSLGGLIGTLVAATLGDWVLPFVYNVGMGGFRTGVLVWLFMGGLVALEQMYVTRGSA